MVLEAAGGYLSTQWIPDLAKRLLKLGRERRDAIDRLNDIFLVNPAVLAKRYVEPRVQILNPVEHRGEGPPSHAEAVPLRQGINDFLESDPEKKDGRHVLFLLGDAGMGKTSALLMLKLTHLARFWPNIHDFQLFKLGPGSLDAIDELPNKRRTVLLLDSLDEDPEALGADRFEPRLRALLQRTKAFRQVVITCRTQFFPRVGRAPIEGRAKVEVESFVCNLLYLSPFVREQVETYLRKVYPNNLWWWLRQRLGHGENPQFERARHLVMDMGELRMRPLLLSYVQDLMAHPDLKTSQDRGTLWRVYDALIEQWLLREIHKLEEIESKRGKARPDEVPSRVPSRKDLRRACRRLALHMARSGQLQVSRDELRSFLAVADVERLTALDLGGRALLNKDADEAFRFAHRTIQEFLVVEELAERVWTSRGTVDMPEPIEASDEMLRFYFAAVTADNTFPVLAPLFDVSQVEDLALLIWPREETAKPGAEHLALKSMQFRHADLSHRDLSGLDLSGIDLSGADLSGADLSRCQLAGISFKDTILTGVVWAGAMSGDIELEPLQTTIIASKEQIDLWPEVPAGTGWIGSLDGSSDERPRHSVEVTAPFALMATPVTNAQFAAFDRAKADLDKPHHPVVEVSWDEAVSFCRWLSQLPGFEGARLPTEEEWEYACRAGTETRYWSGDEEGDLARVGWYTENSGGVTHPVGEKPANPWGLYDMHGNVWEWTASRWKDDYSDQAGGLTVNPAAKPEDLAEPRARRVVRGGGFFVTAGWSRSAYRDHGGPWGRFGNRGFRVLLPRPPAGR